MSTAERQEQGVWSEIGGVGCMDQWLFGGHEGKEKPLEVYKGINKI